MAKYHVSEDGKARPCRAEKVECRLIHGDTPEKAYENDLAVAIASGDVTEFTTEQKSKLQNVSQKEVLQRINDLDNSVIVPNRRFNYDSVDQLKKALRSKEFIKSPMQRLKNRVNMAVGSVRSNFKDPGFRSVLAATGVTFAGGVSMFAALGSQNLALGVAGLSVWGVGVAASTAAVMLDKNKKEEVRAARREASRKNEGPTPIKTHNWRRERVRLS